MWLLPSIVGSLLGGRALAATTTPASPGWMVDRWTVGDGLPMNHAHGLAHGEDGRLWLATYDGLWSFDGQRFARVPVGGADGTPGVRVFALERSPLTADLWLTLDGGEVQRRGPTGVETWRPGLPGPLELRLGRGGGLWAAGPTRCVVLVDPAAPDTPPDFGAPPPGGSDPACPAGGIGALHGGPLRATSDGQVYDGDTLVVDLDHPVRDVLWLDGQLWLATTGAGLVRVRSRVVDVVGAPSGISPVVTRLQWDAATGSVWARSHDDRWWSTAEPGLGVEPAGLHTPRPGQPSGDHKTLPFAPPPWDDAARWWGTQAEVRRETDTGALEPVPGPRGFWQITDALVLPDGSLLVATTESLWRVGLDGARPVLLVDDGPVFSVRSLALLDDETVAFGGGAPAEAGTVDLRTDRAIALAVGSTVRHLRADPAWLWLATESRGLCAVPRAEGEGLQALDPARWRCLDEAGGLGAAGVHASLPDGLGRVWLSANRGLGVVSADALLAFAAGEQDAVGVTWLATGAGLVDAEANGTMGGTVVAAPDGSLYFPTQHGVARVVPARFVEPPAPRVVLDTVQVDGEAAGLVDGVLTLSAEARLVTLRWSAVSLVEAEGVKVRHRMSGDAAWSRPSADSTLSLRGLAPGRHSLELQAGIGERWGPVLRIELQRPARLSERTDLLVAGALVFLLGILLAAGVQRRRAAALARTLQAEIDRATEALRVAHDQLAVDNETLARQTLALDARNAELEELDRLKRRLIANISHELRTPLTLIRGPIEVLAAREPDPGKRDELALASRNAARLDALVQDLLLLSRAESGALPLRAQRVPVPALLGRVLGRFPPERVRLGALPAMAGGELWCDPAILDTALGNLVANALEHGGDAAPVEVEVEVEGEVAEGGAGLSISVRDHGPGVSPAVRADLFGRFEKGEHRKGGLGLGLALARELVELHGGLLEHHEPADGGACFRVWLPLGADHLAVDDIDLDAARPASPPPLPEPPAAGDAPVLVVEDNPELRAFLEAQLGTRHEVVGVGDAEAAARWLARHSPRVVVSDIMLPGMSGLELARHLRADTRLSGTPVLLISARGEVEDRVEGLEVADDYLPKPFSVLELHARVDALARRSRAGGAAPLDAAPGARSAPEAPSPETPAWLDQLCAALDAHIEAHLADPALDASALARAVAVSPRTLSDRLREAGQPSPAALIRERRLDRARALLDDGRYQTVGEVAAAVGLSRSYFSRAFKARFGFAPGTGAPPPAAAPPSSGDP